MSFAQNLQCIRTRNGLTQEQLAEELNVTRQSVSKWESGASFPEMDTLLKICERYGVGLDELLRGSVEEHHEEETKGFVRHMKIFSIQMALSISAILVALAVISFLDGIVSEAFSAAFFLTIVTVSVITLIVSGMEHSRYVKKHPKIQPIYSEREVERADRIFSWAIAGGVGIALIGIIISSFVDDAYDRVIYSNASGAIFLAMIALAVGIFVFFGIRRSIYHVEDYNKENAPASAKNHAERLTGAVCGVIMLIATCVFLIWGFWETPGGAYTGNWRDYTGHWNISWISFAVGGILCGIASIIINITVDKGDGGKQQESGTDRGE